MCYLSLRTSNTLLELFSTCFFVFRLFKISNMFKSCFFHTQCLNFVFLCEHIKTSDSSILQVIYSFEWTLNFLLSNWFLVTQIEDLIVFVKPQHLVRSEPKNYLLLLAVVKVQQHTV